MSLDRDLTQTVVAVTGPTAGIGRATARALVGEVHASSSWAGDIVVVSSVAGLGGGPWEAV